jgi:hypothetical protein
VRSGIVLTIAAALIPLRKLRLLGRAGGRSSSLKVGSGGVLSPYDGCCRHPPDSLRASAQLRYEDSAPALELSTLHRDDRNSLRALKIGHHFIGEQLDLVPRPPGVTRAGVEIEGYLVDAELVT